MLDTGRGLEVSLISSMSLIGVNSGRGHPCHGLSGLQKTRMDLSGACLPRIELRTLLYSLARSTTYIVSWTHD